MGGFNYRIMRKKGYKHSEETKRKIKEKAKLKTGEKSNNWKGGISNLVKTCLYCKKSFRGKHIRKFCCQQCYWNFRKIFYIKEKHPQWKGGLCNQSKNCEVCGKTFIGYKTRLFCSKNCQASFKSKREKNPNWKGGISFELYPIDWTDDLREVMRKRDSYICQLCGICQDGLKGRFRKLDIHHIDYDKDNLDPKNLISLCKGCHMKTNHNRAYWINYFKG